HRLTPTVNPAESAGIICRRVGPSGSGNSGAGQGPGWDKLVLIRVTLGGIQRPERQSGARPPVLQPTWASSRGSCSGWGRRGPCRGPGLPGQPGGRPGACDLKRRGIARTVPRYSNRRRTRSPRWWDTLIGQEKQTLKRHTGPVLAVSFDPDGRRLATASID